MKYLINKDMYDAIVWMLPDATPIKEMVSELKPIEPLSEKEILKSIQSCGQALHGRIALTRESGPYDIDTPTVVATQFVRAIEAHILGEKHEN